MRRERICAQATSRGGLGEFVPAPDVRWAASPRSQKDAPREGRGLRHIDNAKQHMSKGILIPAAAHDLLQGRWSGANVDASECAHVAVRRCAHAPLPPLLRVSCALNGGSACHWPVLVVGCSRGYMVRRAPGDDAGCDGPDPSAAGESGGTQRIELQRFHMRMWTDCLVDPVSLLSPLPCEDLAFRRTRRQLQRKPEWRKRRRRPRTGGCRERQTLSRQTPTSAISR